MHREDAQTVSYTEIAATGRKAQMRYAGGPLCTKKPGAPRALLFVGKALAKRQPR
jgi:hypothetical protein